MKKKLASNSGESLVEVLVSLIIITLTIAFLFTAIMVANKTNVSIRESKANDFSYAASGTAKTISTKTSGVMSSGKTVTVYKSGDYYYFK